MAHFSCVHVMLENSCIAGGFKWFWIQAQPFGFLFAKFKETNSWAWHLWASKLKQLLQPPTRSQDDQRRRAWHGVVQEADMCAPSNFAHCRREAD